MTQFEQFEEKEEWLIEQNSLSGNDKHIWEIDKYLTLKGMYRISQLINS